MGDRKEMLDAVQAAAATTPAGDTGSDGSRYDKLLALVKRHSTRSDSLNLGEAFQAASKKEHQKLWNGVLEVVQPIVDEGRCLPAGEYVDEDHTTADQANDSDNDSNGDGDGTTPEAPPRPTTPDASSKKKQQNADGGAETSCPRRPGRGRRGGGGGGVSSPASSQSRKSNSADVSLALEVLHAAATLAFEFIADTERVAPRALLDTAVSLHHIMLSLQGLQGAAVQAVIAKVCDMWWTQGRLGGEHLVPQLIPYMLVKSFHEDAKEADVKRMYGLRTALLVLDFDDEDSAPLKTLLLRLFMLPLYLKSSEGRRLLVYLFGLHPSLVLDIHEVIKQQMPGAKRSVLASYGEIYFKVWRGAEAEQNTAYLEKIEMHCLQDLMHACIHAATRKMHSNLLIVLDGLHSQKKLKGVDAALLRLYGPVLWRSLRVANATVRAQACQVLVDAFPLHDPTAGAATYDGVLQQQFDALTTLLEDDHAEVRAVAAKGSCRILSVYWEMVPRDTARALLARVAGRLACDASAPLVRLAAVEGLALLLECPESHGVLNAMLPGVWRLIHDTNKKVRVAFVRLLEQVKNARSIKYYHVVNVDNLLARLAEDHLKCPASAAGLSKLILNSYFPSGAGVAGATQVGRCLTLLEQDQGAATAFYSRLHQSAGVPSAAKMLAMLVRTALYAARTSEEDDVDDEEDDEILPENDKSKQQLQMMSAVLNLIATIWESILPALEKAANEPSLALIQQTVTGEALALLHWRFSRSDERCRAAFMRLAGLAGGDLAPEMLEDVVVEMLSLPETAPPSVYGPTVDLLCAWGQHEHLMGAILHSLRTAFIAASATSERSSMSTSSPANESRGKRRRLVSSESTGGVGASDAGLIPGLPPALALSMLSHLLAGGSGNAATTMARDELMADNGSSVSLEDVLTLARDMADRRFSPDIATAFGSCLNANASGGDTVKPTIANTTAARLVKEEEKRCPDALLVRAIEALGRVYMHREAALLVGEDSGAGSRAGAGEQEDDELLPMPFSLKMRELMVWTTDAVLPVLGAGDSGDDGGDDFRGDGMADGTPVKCAPDMTAMSPSPMPPPRSRARGGDSNKDKENGSIDNKNMATAGAGRVKLAESVLGVVVLLASEWVEVGSGLAEVSLRVDTWGQLLLSMILRGEEGSRERVAAVLPQLCRLSHQLCVQEAQGARPPESLWEVLLRCADLGTSVASCGPASDQEDGGSGGGVVSPCVQKFMAAYVALQGRTVGLRSVAERLLEFMFTQASQLENGQSYEDDGIHQDGASVESFVHLRIRSHDDAGAGAPELSPSSSDLELSRPAAAVLASVARSRAMSKAAGVLVLSHLATFRPDDAEGAPWPLFCAHILGALLDSAPAKARLELAADAHVALKATAAAASSLSASSITRANMNNPTSNTEAQTSAEANENDEDSADGDDGEEGNAAGREGDERTGSVAGEVSTGRQAAAAIGAIYDRLEAARRSAVSGGGGGGGDDATAGSGRGRSARREVVVDRDGGVGQGAAMDASPAVVRVGA